MKKAIGILFLGIFLISSTELRQLLKIPLLIQHYIEHKGNDPDISIITFLTIHYNETTKIDLDFHKDQQLPFKSHDCCNSYIVTGFVPEPIYTLVTKSFFLKNQPRFVANESFISSAYLASIWQPPKA